MIKSGGALRSSGKVQHFQCRKCGEIYVSDIPFNRSGRELERKKKCHVCGKNSQTSYSKPICYDWFKKKYYFYLFLQRSYSRSVAFLSM